MQPEDELTNQPVDDDEVLWRRLAPDWVKTAEDGSLFIVSAAFKDNIDGNISVHISSLTTIEQVRHLYPFVRLAAVKAKVVKELGFSIVRDPQPDDPSHALLRPPPNYRTRSKKSRIGDARVMARSAELLVERDA